MMILKHLLPRTPTWATVIDRTLSKFVEAFSVVVTDAKAFFDGVYGDLLPADTRQLDLWEAQFGLPALGLSEAVRRSRLEAAWSAVGGQSPAYIQNTLQDAGFDVYVHEWWVPGTTTPRNPLTYLQQTFPGVSPGVDCGESDALCGEPGALCGEQDDPLGFPLVNKVPDTARVVPNDSAEWPFFLYIGGETFGTLAQVDPIRRDEFEALCLKICPAHLWLGMLVEY